MEHTEKCDIVSTLAKPVQIRQWTICGLPTDSLSIENGIIMNSADRWPLMIDPQGQANRFIKKLAQEDATNGFDVVKMTDGKLLTRALENGIRFGKWVIIENVLEYTYICFFCFKRLYTIFSSFFVTQKKTLDPQLEPILQRAVFSLKGEQYIKLGDNTIHYNNSFKLLMTTKLPNPHYPPELQVKVTLLNFTVTPVGLQDQMLGLVVAKEAPQLEIKKNELVVSSAAMKKQLQEIETKILQLLKEAKGDILDDENLICFLSESKKTVRIFTIIPKQKKKGGQYELYFSQEINVQVKEQEKVENEIDSARSGYLPVAYRASVLYFCVSDLAPIDPMYQFSLQWFFSLFENGIENATPSNELHKRLQHINDYFTLSLYRNVCRSLFEKHKLLFSFLLTVKILQSEKKISAEEYRFLVQVGHIPNTMVSNPSNGWLDDNVWRKVLALENLAVFNGFVDAFVKNTKVMQRYYNASVPHEESLPGEWDKKLNDFQKLIVVRTLRPDKMNIALQAFISKHLGQIFIEPPPFDLQGSYDISKSFSPLIFILSSGADPYEELSAFAKVHNEQEKMLSISLGMGQGPIAEKYISQAKENGGWVVLQNCHLCTSWLPKLEKICEELQTNSAEVHPSFRLWLTSMPTPKFPVSILQNGIKMTNEPPKGLRANLLRSYLGFDDDFLNASKKPDPFKKLLFGLCLYHALILDRRKYGPLGWNIPYAFRESDLRVCIQQLHDFLDMFEEIPFKVIHFLIYDINYGGRVTDEIDRHTSKTILNDFITPDALCDDYKFSPSGVYRSIPACNKEGYLTYIKSLPLVPEPEVFGFHENANITFATEETDTLFSVIASILPRTSHSSGKTKDEMVGETARDIEIKVPAIINVDALMKQYPTTHEESMNTVLVQEAIRYNRLLQRIKKSLHDLQKALKGEMVMTTELETMGNALFDNLVPQNWEAVAYPIVLHTLQQKNGGPLYKCFVLLYSNWIKNGTPNVYWISGFFFPQAFLTGTLQNYARKHVKPIDTISFGFKVMSHEEKELEPPSDGCYIKGLFLEGCRWDRELHALSDSKPRELFVEMPTVSFVFFFKKNQDRKENCNTN
ncbi:dynein heavy chain [Reticulomyxa filosa]|uniref:Dynein heavy chain n=1 Tax=Reticulomyxa filosa TaxID=46433 RepID=X6P457_RETFI|nr:dynein heavy chain [Reticulomyxa filosa]|eukprot:ETO33001.1 dynein heavy chain [Reticulomyxa filosa]